MANFFQPEINNKGKVMKISTIAKYVDQPLVLNGLQKKMPVLLIGGGSAFGLYDVYKHRKGKKSDENKDQHKKLLRQRKILYPLS